MRWADTQAAFAAALCGGQSASTGAIEAAIKDDGGAIPVSGRLAIYRNNISLTLADALAETYRAVAALVGEDYFARLAQGYIAAHPAYSANLNDYGEAFAAFLSAHPVARSLPYLPDMARFEWAWQRSFFAPEAPPADLPALHRLDDAALLASRLGLCPSLHWLQPDYPVSEIWHFCIREQGRGEPPAAAADTHTLALWRDARGVRTQRIEKAVFVALCSLGAGKTLAAAIDDASGADDGFQAERLLSLLFEHGWVR